MGGQPRVGGLTGRQQFEEGPCGVLLLLGFETKVEVGSVSPKRCDTSLDLKAVVTVIDGRNPFRPGPESLRKSAVKT
jgi:hypothetical protein